MRLRLAGFLMAIASRLMYRAIKLSGIELEIVISIVPKGYNQALDGFYFLDALADPVKPQPEPPKWMN
jgi:hypothetical protein